MACIRSRRDFVGTVRNKAEKLLHFGKYSLGKGSANCLCFDTMLLKKLHLEKDSVNELCFDTCAMFYYSWSALFYTCTQLVQ